MIIRPATILLIDFSVGVAARTEPSHSNGKKEYAPNHTSVIATPSDLERQPAQGLNTKPTSQERHPSSHGQTTASDNERKNISASAD